MLNGTLYYYVTNLQGDIIAMLDETGTAVVEYSYDAWGNTTITGTLKNTVGRINPLRYRGYYYDTDIGLYYLQSRYYDANIGRFINADEPTLLLAGVSNLFSYCDNNPISNNDPNGFLPRWLHALKGVRLLISGLISLVSSVKKGFVISALGSYTAWFIGFLAAKSLLLLPLGQFWGTVVNVGIIISLVWRAKSILVDVPNGLWHLKQSIWHTHR